MFGPLDRNARAPPRELLADLVDGPEKVRADGAGAQAEVIGDLLEREILVMTQAEDRLLLRRQLPFRPGDGNAELRRHELALRIGPLIHRLEHRLRLIVTTRGEEA